MVVVVVVVVVVSGTVPVSVSVSVVVVPAVAVVSAVVVVAGAVVVVVEAVVVVVGAVVVVAGGAEPSGIGQVVEPARTESSHCLPINDCKFVLQHQLYLGCVLGSRSYWGGKYSLGCTVAVPSPLIQLSYMQKDNFLHKQHLSKYYFIRKSA